MERLADVDTARNEGRVCRLDVGHDEKEAARRARHGRREPLAEVDGARESGGVNCTPLSPSLVKSTSSRHPRLV